MRTIPGLRSAFLAFSLAFHAGCGTETPDPTPVSVVAADSAWIEAGAMYEVFVRDFSPTGDFQGLLEGLDRIEATGANIVWLMPIHPVGELNRKGSLGSSYSVVDYRAVNPAYGDTADFRRLVDEVHERGMRLIIDWVPNHTAWDSPWVSEHPDWYTRNEQGEMTEPRNDDGTLTGWSDVVELDYDNPELRREMIAAMRWWLDEFGIDGFRVDVAGMVPTDFWREALPELREAGDILLLAEWGTLDMHVLGYDLTYGWEAYNALKEVWRREQPASAFVEREIEESAMMPEGGGRLRFTTNHDETAWDQPPVILFGGPAGARAAFTANALLPGMPLLYNGQEVESPQQLGLFEREVIDWERPGADSARAYYRHVIELARALNALAGDDLGMVEVSAPSEVIAYRRDDAVVLVNARPRPIRVTVANVAVAGARELLTGATQAGDTVALPAHGAMVLELPR